MCAAILVEHSKFLSLYTIKGHIPMGTEKSTTHLLKIKPDEHLSVPAERHPFCDVVDKFISTQTNEFGLPSGSLTPSVSAFRSKKFIPDCG
jgi:hypothetical protein